MSSDCPGMSSDFLGCLLTFLGCLLIFLGYHLTVLGYPLTVLGFPLTVLSVLHTLKLLPEGRGPYLSFPCNTAEWLLCPSQWQSVGLLFLLSLRVVPEATRKLSLRVVVAGECMSGCGGTREVWKMKIGYIHVVHIKKQ